MVELTEDPEPTAGPEPLRGAGALTWAIRVSFVHYVSVVAHGSVETAGGAILDEDGRFVFPAAGVEQEGDDWRMTFTGSVRFSAHHGFLELVLRDPKVVVGPAGGVLVAATSDDPEQLVPVVATAALPPLLVGDRLLWEALPTRLTAPGVPLFGDVYPVGTDLAPLRMDVALSS